MRRLAAIAIDQDGFAASVGHLRTFRKTRLSVALERSYGMGEKLASYGNPRRRHLEGLDHIDPAMVCVAVPDQAAALRSKFAWMTS